VTKFLWRPGSPMSGPLSTVTFHPSATYPRGAYDIVGLLVTDLLPDPGDELIVGTLSGDLIVLGADNLNDIWRTHVPGAIGFFNSMLAEDLDGDQLKELYVAGSRGCVDSYCRRSTTNEHHHCVRPGVAGFCDSLL